MGSFKSSSMTLFMLLGIFFLPLLVEGLCTISVESMTIYTSTADLQIQAVQAGSATFALLWFDLAMDQISCPLTTVGATVTGNIDGTIYPGINLPDLDIGDGDFGAPFSGVVLATANPSHTAVVTWRFLATNDALYPDSVVATTVFGFTVIGTSVFILTEPFTTFPETTTSTFMSSTSSFPVTTSKIVTPLPGPTISQPRSSASQAPSTSTPTQSQSSRLSSSATIAIATSISAVAIIAILAGTIAWYKLRVRQVPNPPPPPQVYQTDWNPKGASEGGGVTNVRSDALHTGDDGIEPPATGLRYPDADAMHSARVGMWD